jgi:hypothetical protein
MAYKYLLCQHLEAVLMFHVYIFDWNIKGSLQSTLSGLWY